MNRGLVIFHRIGDNDGIARKAKSGPQKAGLYYAREGRRMSRTELVRCSGISKQQLSRLENGLIRLRVGSPKAVCLCSATHLSRFGTGGSSTFPPRTHE